MKRTRCALAVWLLASPVAIGAQSPVIVPPIAEQLPGNAALSMPLRWSYGTMQVIVDASLLPANFVGNTITGLRLRRPAFLGEPSYPALQRTMTVRAGFAPMLARQLTTDLMANRPGTLPSNQGSLVTAVGPTSVSIPATNPVSGGESLGDEFLVLTFSQPLPVTAGNLFVEFETSDAPLSVETHQWVDAVWLEDGNDQGYAVPVGDGSCTHLTTPYQLTWTASGAPLRGTDAALRLSGGDPQALVIWWLGLDPLTAGTSPVFVGYGASLGPLVPGLANCHQWVPGQAILGALADPVGGLDISFPLVAASTATGDRIGIQCAQLGPQALPTISNGLILQLDTAGVDDQCATVFFLSGSTQAAWLPDKGLMPVLYLDL